MPFWFKRYGTVLVSSWLYNSATAKSQVFNNTTRIDMVSYDEDAWVIDQPPLKSFLCVKQ